MKKIHISMSGTMIAVLFFIMTITGCMLDMEGKTGDSGHSTETLADIEKKLSAVTDPVEDRFPDLYQYYYRIHVRKDNKILDVSLGSHNLYANQTAHGNSNQQFMIIPVFPDGRNFFLVSRYNGGVIDIHHKNNIYMYDNYPHGGTNQMFYVSYSSGGYYEISSPKGLGVFDMCLSSKTRDPFNHPSQCKNNIYHFTSSSLHGDNQQFVFVAPTDADNEWTRNHYTFKYPVPRTRQYRREFDIEPPHITSFTDIPDDVTPAVTISEGKIPFIYINTGNRSYQIEETPYYRIIRKHYWKCIYPTNKPAGQTEQISIKHEVGVVNSSTSSIENLTKNSWSYNSEIGYTDSNNITYGSAMTVSEEVQVKTVSTSTTQIQSTDSITITKTLGPEKHINFAIYQLVDFYILEEMNGNHVTDWTIYPKYQQIQVYYDGTLQYENEPNNNPYQANGPVVSNIKVGGKKEGTAEKLPDWFYVDVQRISPMGFHLVGPYTSATFYHESNVNSAEISFSQGSEGSNGKDYIFSPQSTGRYYMKIDGYPTTYSFILTY